MPDRYAVLVGCNYPGSKYPLRGCINDVNGMKDMLKNHFGFTDDHMTILIDTDQAYTQPTGANIKAKLAETVAKVKDGDIFFFHFSGHGTQVPGDEADGKDEALCGSDMNVITDEDLKGILVKLPHNCKFTFIADCCHSGTLLDQENIVISGPKPGDPPAPKVDIGALASLFGMREGGEEARDIKSRSLPTSALFEHLSKLLGRPVDNNSFARSMTDAFGKDAPAKAMAVVKKLMDPEMRAQLKADPLKGAMGLLSIATGGSSGGGGGGGLGGMLGGLLGGGGGGGGGHGGEPNLQVSGGGASSGVALPKNLGVLITGCQPHETSADACPDGNPDRAFGALSNTMQTVVNAHYSQNPGQPLSYRQLVTSVRDIMGQAKFTQNPCLECSHDNAETTFLV